MLNYKNLFPYCVLLCPLLFITSCKTDHKKNNETVELRDSTIIDREYWLEASMLGYFGDDGTRNPTLKANKGDRVRITITNGETMTHDIAMEKLGIKSSTLLEEGSSTQITFWAEADDTYFCTVPGHRAAGMVGKFQIVEGKIDTPVIAGIVPTKNGDTLNLNFEKGDLTGWKAEGDAFKNPIFSDPTPIHEENAQVGFAGNYFLSSGGTKDYKKKGKLTSSPFEVQHPFASFKVSGGALADTRVEIVLAENDKVIFKSTGQGRATLQPVVVDLSDYLNQKIYIRIIDNETGTSPIPYIRDDVWAHINFDDFLFYPSRPSFPNQLRQEDIIILPPLDPIVNSGLSGKEAAKAMTLPDDFKITLAAAEPDIIRPISFTIDARGRLWVVEGHTYPVPAEEGKGKDRILIFEDTNGDGNLDKKKVFIEGLNMASGIEVGMGGVWVGAAPYLLFIPLDAEKDLPAGPPEVLLDGWGLDDTHEVLNNLRWGPDGWLYGVHGVFTHSNVGKPGTPDSERQKLNAAVWRYHPTRHEFEIFSEGTSNPWGIDFNDYGHPFITVCVIPHMFHVVQGARYIRQGGEHFNPYTYGEIKEISDHVHYLGDRGPHAGNFRSAAAGGGHAHAGAMIYLGGDTWPEKYKNTIFMNNINGARLNNDQLTRSRSGYIASHNDDFLVMNDSWSQWLNFKYDPSGSVFAIDWYDKNQCHSANPDVHDKELGRIFKITHKNDKWKKVNLYEATDLELVDYHLSENEWYVRQARTLLQERGPNPKVHSALKKILKENPESTKRLRALWTLHATEGLTEAELGELLEQKDEYIRSWAIQLLAEKKEVSTSILKKFESLAKNDSSPLVRLYLTSAMMRLDLEKRWGVLEALSVREEDAEDHNIPLMLWYATEPLAEINPKRALALSMRSKMPNLLPYMIRRTAEINSSEVKKALNNLRGELSEPHQKMIDSLLNK
ncbi:dehydrogenase [Euzebyella marina]|uniref:Dehydrogenase n=1 Tax=Euzebyella marina TaxID=1761453 RepID=A0A3G2LAH3_9FLAO|nr:PVC-type heme-binding CxxCH protein [Euzebyella marina]AYN69250.1 dehydrogenase [Euzebyella marina]